MFIPSIAATLFRAGFFFETFLCGAGAGVFSSAGSAILVDCPKSSPGPGRPGRLDQTRPDPRCPGPGPAGEWTRPGQNLVMNSLKKSL